MIMELDIKEKTGGKFEPLDVVSVSKVDTKNDKDWKEDGLHRPSKKMRGKIGIIIKFCEVNGIEFYNVMFLRQKTLKGELFKGEYYYFFEKELNNTNKKLTKTMMENIKTFIGERVADWI